MWVDRLGSISKVKSVAFFMHYMDKIISIRPSRVDVIRKVSQKREAFCERRFAAL